MGKAGTPTSIVNRKSKKSSTPSSGGGASSVKYDLGGMPVERSAPKDFVGKNFNTLEEAEKFFKGGGTPEQAAQQRQGVLDPVRTSPSQAETPAQTNTADPRLEGMKKQLLGAQASLNNLPQGSAVTPGAGGVANAAAPTPTQNRFQQGFAGTANLPPPGDFKSGFAQASALTPKAEDTTTVDALFDQDPTWQNIQTEIQDFLSPIKQKDTLLSEYKKMYKESGLDALDDEIIDAETIIDGTEDDIRNEVQAAGGFATESQVQAMALSRNKSLLKRYNAMIAQREATNNRLNTMINLSAQDRQLAESRTTKQLDVLFKMAEFKERANNNIKEQYRWLTQTVGVDGLYDAYKSDPRQLGFLERSMGINPGGLRGLADTARQERVQKQADLTLDRTYKQAQIDNIYSQIGERAENNTVMVDQFGKVVVKPTEALKLNKEITGNDAYKAMQKGIDSLRFLKQFESTFDQTGATSAVFSPRQNADLKAKYNTAILNLKEFFNLGVLNGPDETILKGVLPDPTNRSAALTVGSLGIYKPSSSTRAGIENMKQMIESSIDDRYKSLSSQYGDYSSQSVPGIQDLNRVYVQQKAALNPQIQQLLQQNPDLSDEDVISIITE